MKRFLSLLLAALMLFGTVTAFTSCGNEPVDEITVYLVDRIYDFDPTQAYEDDEAMKIFSLLFEPLFRLNADGEVENALASGYDYYQDARTGEFKLDVDIRETYWSNGSRILAEEVAWTWKSRILAQDVSSKAAPLLYEIKGAIDAKQGNISIDNIGLDAPEDDLLTITFDADWDDFESKADRAAYVETFLRNLTSVALAPVREDSLLNKEEYWAKSSLVVTGGMFQIKTLNFDDQTGCFTLKRNPYYAGYNSSIESLAMLWPSALYDTASFQIGGNFNATKAAQYHDIMAQLYDGTAPTEEDAYRFLDMLADTSVFYVGCLSLEQRAARKESAVTSDLLSTMSLVFNQTVRHETDNLRMLLANTKVRLALSKALDRESLATQLVFARPATGLISYGVFEGNDPNGFRAAGDASGALIATTADLSAATALLREAIGEGASATGISSIDIICLPNESDYAVAKSVADTWNQLFESVGWRRVFGVTISGLAGTATEDINDKTRYYKNDYQEKYKSGNFDIILVDYQMLSPDAFTVLAGFSSAIGGGSTDWAGHISGYANAAYDALIAEAFSVKLPSARAAILHSAEAQLLNDMPIIPLVFNQNYYLSKNIKDIDTDFYGFTVFADAVVKK